MAQDPSTFVISRNTGQDALTVYFTLAGTAALGTDYTVSFGSGGGYVDETTGQGYVVIPAGASSAGVDIVPTASGQATTDPGTVELDLNAGGNEFGGVLAYQMPVQAAAAMATALLPATQGQFSVTGYVYYAGPIPDTPSKPGPQPVRFALVRVYENLNSLQSVKELGEGYTDANGKYVVKFGNVYDKGVDLSVVVYTLSDKSLPMQQINVRSAQTWSYTINGGKGNLPTQANPGVAVQTAIITDTDTNGKAFWVYDASIDASQFQATLPGFVKGTTSIDYPFPFLDNRQTSLTIGKEPHILRDDYNNFDTIIHEYGHAVAQIAGFFPMDVVAQGFWSHRTGQDIRIRHLYSAYTLKLAFSEGWADFFSMAAQNYVGIGDGKYGNVRRFPVETNEIRGETDEIGIMRILWDLADPKNEGTDRVEFSYDGKTGIQALFKLVVDNRVQTVDGLWKALMKVTPPLPDNTPDVATLSA